MHLNSITSKGLTLLGLKSAQIIMGTLGVALILIGYAHAISAIGHDATWPANTDFGIYRNAGDQLATGHSPYEFSSNQEFRYVYPPLLADIVAVLDRTFGHHLVWIVWPSAAVISLVGGIVLAMRGFGDRAQWGTILLVAGLFMTGRATWSDLYHGQINQFIFFLMIVGLFASRSHRPFAAALCWALIIVFKPFLGIIVLYLAWKRRWRDAFLTFSLSGALFLASFAPTGVATFKTVVEWLETTKYASSPAFAALPDNQSFYGMLLRMTTPNRFVQPWLAAPALPGMLLLVLYSLSILVMVRFVPRGQVIARDANVWLKTILEFQIPLALYMACGPLTEGDHLYFVLPAAIAAGLIWRRRVIYRGANRAQWAFVALCWAACFLTVVSPVLLPLSFITERSWTLLNGPGVLLSGRFGFTLMLAAVASAVLLYSERSAEKALAVSPRASAQTSDA